LGGGGPERDVLGVGVGRVWKRAKQRNGKWGKASKATRERRKIWGLSSEPVNNLGNYGDVLKKNREKKKQKNTPTRNTKKMPGGRGGEGHFKQR